MTEALHLLKNFVDFWHHILAINHDGSVGAVPQSHMEHSAALHIHSTRKENTHSHTVLMAAYIVGDQGVKKCFRC